MENNNINDISENILNDLREELQSVGRSALIVLAALTEFIEFVNLLDTAGKKELKEMQVIELALEKLNN